MGKRHAPGFLRIVEDAKSRIHELTVQDVRTKLDSDRSFFLVDVREESEWAGGHLPSAIHLSKGIIERDIEATVADSGAEIICYCGGGYRSALVADNLRKMGYTNVWSMDGGFGGWRAAGLPIESERA